MFGQQQYAVINRRIQEALAVRRPLVMAHRGTGQGTIVENTPAAVRAAVSQGADIVELDVVRSTDGEFFLFHDGYEAMHFTDPTGLKGRSGEEIRSLLYAWASTPASADPRRVATLDEVLDQPQTLLNLDRTWHYWNTLLGYLDDRVAPGSVLLKSPPGDWVHTLAEHPVAYPYVAMVRTEAEIDAFRGTAGLNLLGFELLAADPSHRFARPDFLSELHRDGYLVLVNAINLSDGIPLFCGWDDNRSVLDDPDAGWGELVRLGVDIIQTDWPDLLRRYLADEDSGEREAMLP